MAVLQPVLGDASPTRPPGAGDDLPSLLTNVHYLFRDWGWPSEPDGENERALASIDEVLEGEPIGRTLVLGAGACRLAYDLTRRDKAAETIVVDVDPLLFAVAHAVVRGGTVSLREGYAEVNELGNMERPWQLAARDGSISEEQFHFLIADALEPPFASGVFDTVITPWFIDAIPADVRDVISTAHRLLKPSGRWLNAGPLRYTPQVPVARRFTREELFALAECAGFYVGPWTASSRSSLVSKHTGRGNVEWVMTFAARKLDGAIRPVANTPPAWLLFRHMAVPMFAGQSLVWSRDSLAQTVISSIDGQRTLDDIAHVVATGMRSSNLSRSQIREAVRQCLAEVHPASHT
jgi:SAM-dependent methyltransferase